MAASLEPFGRDHLAALATVAGCAVAGAALVRSEALGARTVRRFIAGALVLSLVLLMLFDARAGVSWRSYAPLQLCDVLVPIAVLALLRDDPLAFELTLTWSFAGTVPALLTPDVREGFPHFRFVLYFVQHGGLVVATATLLS
ncbi:MAG: YwaF family protein, partial [Deltaproteobacteria bacterium]|nr:YwaF family protein [Deltaproteobacteria bacterium]